MHYLVTGGAGFIGSALAGKLISDKHKIVILDNLLTGYKSNIPTEAEFIEADCSTASAMKALDNRKFDAIFHFAGQSSGEISFESPVLDLNCNATSTLQLLDYAVRTKCPRFIYASTMSVYGQKFNEINERRKEQYSENDPTEPLSFYAVGKLASERYLTIYQETYGINTTALRLFNTYGPGQNMDNLRQGMVSIYLKQLADSQYDHIIIKGESQRFRDFIHVDDIVKVTARLLNMPESFGEIYNVGTGVKTTVGQLLLALKAETGIDKLVEYAGSTPGDQFGVYADNAKLLSLLPDINFIQLEKGLEYAASYVKEKIES